MVTFIDIGLTVQEKYIVIAPNKKDTKRKPRKGGQKTDTRYKTQTKVFIPKGKSIHWLLCKSKLGRQQLEVCQFLVYGKTMILARLFQQEYPSLHNFLGNLSLNDGRDQRTLVKVSS